MKIYNTIKQSLEELKLSQEVKMYVCGITPYDEVHLGHGRCYVVFDILRRYLKYKGYNVKYVQNFTDVDDKIINRAKESGVSIGEITRKYIDSYFEVEKKLNITPASFYPKVTEHIPEIISAVEDLLKKGFAYITESGVYFEIDRFSGYGKLSKRNLEDLISGIRVEKDETKKKPLDFALWKFAKKDEPVEVQWSSPWGNGRPGWHIECSVMSTKYLGETLDIHGGGQDLIFPHHENEIAQSEALTGKEFVRYWIHNGFVTVNKEKMSKSLKNIFSLKDLFNMYDPMIIRLFLLSQHYRNPLDFSLQEIDQFKIVYQKLKNVKVDVEFYLNKTKDDNQKISDMVLEKVEKLICKFDSAMEDDLNTSVTLSVIHEIVNLINSLDKMKKRELRYVYEKYILMLNVLGINLNDFSVPEEVKNLVYEREFARKNKDFNKADEIRKQICKYGFVVEDTPLGPKIKEK